MDRKYKGITFEEGMKIPFSDFKTAFESTHVFKEIPSDERESELKKAYKIATHGNIPITSSKRQETKS